MPTDGNLVLGRAFLQAAFYAVHWSQKCWFLSQAPGPDYSFIKNAVDIEPTTTTITGTENSWENTWASFWTALPSNVVITHSGTNSSSSSTNSSTRTSLSTGAKVGISIGCAFAAVAIVGIVAWFWIRHRQGTKVVDTLPPQDYVRPRVLTRGFWPVEISGGKRDTWHELDHNPSFVGYYGNQSPGQTSEVHDSQNSTRASNRLRNDGSEPYELSQ
ncbi:hypothetical protein N7462_010865 [Penicillium macrosclerotiorum]|uniref:uncharacterized protein n=1 Tax=Penicillium macrosclerotiorum TaxID=303699 RepID=UPI0025493628|nr:uncharacterized protein N7462_010865 [Penicillium macrosclerotiorum]KAJ5669795.1 hypothetical protein N7462_010865 [Penicillium macrosclerotiorum]